MRPVEEVFFKSKKECRFTHRGLLALLKSEYLRDALVLVERIQGKAVHKISPERRAGVGFEMRQ